MAVLPDHSRSQARSWCFTLNNPAAHIDLAAFAGLTYGIYQEEVGENGTYHFQGWLYFSTRKRFAQVRELIPGAHLEKARGTPVECRAYCSKEDTRVPGTQPIEFGEFDRVPRQGQRSDIEEAAMSIFDGATDLQLFREHTAFYVKYDRAIGRIRGLREPVERVGGGTTFLLLGGTGLGKSRYAYSLYPGIFAKPDGAWFDGYQNELQILLDDFDGSDLTIGQFLRLCDRYPLRSPVKGGFITVQANQFVITANDHPINWYPGVSSERRKALYRRISFVLWFEPGPDGRVVVKTYLGKDFFKEEMRTHDHLEPIEVKTMEWYPADYEQPDIPDLDFDVPM